MRQITASHFKVVVMLDRAWASKLTDPVEITNFCDMGKSRITHLSPLLHFTGRNESGHSAKFDNCKYLKIAEGKFSRAVDFSTSEIEKIGDLSCGEDNHGHSAGFWGCKSLKIAEGNFSGSVAFANSGIEKIGELACGKNVNGVSASFRDCESLKIAKGNFSGCVDFSQSAIKAIRDLSCGKDNEGDCAYFLGCKSLKVAEGKFEGSVWFNQSGIEKIGNLSCGENNDKGFRLNVENCPNLKSIPITFNPKGIRAAPELIRNLTKTRAYIQKKRAEIVEIEL